LITFITKQKINKLNSEIVLQVRGVSKSIKGVPVLSDFGMEVYKGSICGVVGPNDCGKTMLLRTITALVNPDKGKIEIFGRNLIPYRSEISSKLGLMIGEPVFYDHLTAFDNLAIFSRYSGGEKDNDEINRVLKLVNLSELSDTKVKNFASGDRKKLGIAMAIYGNPPLILLDEPFVSLDLKSLIEIKTLLLTLNKQRGTTFVIASKQLSELEGFIDRLVLMDGGSLIAEGNVDELTGRSKIGLLIDTSDNDMAFKILKESELPIDSIIIEDELIRINCERETIPFINKFLLVSDIQVYMLKPDNVISSYYLTFTK